MSMNSALIAVLFNLQTAKDAPATLDASHVLGVVDPNYSLYEGDKVSSDIVKPYEGNNVEFNANPYSTLNFKIQMPVIGAVVNASTEYLLSKLLRISAFVETIDDVGALIDYELTDNLNGSPYGTFEYELDGQKFRMENARGVWSMEINAKGYIIYSFDLMGDYADPVSTVDFSAVDISAWEQNLIPVNADNTPVFQFFGQDCILSSFSLSTNQGQSYESYVNDKGHRFNGKTRKPSGSITIRAPKLATFDFFAKLKTHDGQVRTGALSFEHGTDAGSKFAVSIPKLQITSISPNDNNGEWDYQIAFNVLPTLGNDDFKLTYK